MDANLFLFDEKPVEDEVIRQSDEIREAMNAMLETYINDEEYEGDLRNILEEDDYLTEELVDKLALLNFMEGAPGSDYSKEDREQAYLTVIDSFFELAKLISPLNGFGKDRLLAGLSLIREFEEQHWLLSTRIVPENAEAFSELISVEQYDEILAGRKQGIGALRHVGGECYAAGAVVYSVYEDPEYQPHARIDWIMTHERLREKGIANFLLALVIEAVIKPDSEKENADAFLCVELPVRQEDEGKEQRETDTLENFFDSWQFGFSMSYASEFVIKLSDVGEMEAGEGSSTEDIRSLAELGDKGEELLRDFWRKCGNHYDDGLAALPYAFFDPDVSCVYGSDSQIDALLLFHRYKNGDYHYECFRSKEELDLTHLPGLIAYARGAAAGRADGDPMIAGSFASEEGSEAAGELIPKARVPMVYRGVLYTPDEVITSEEWGKLREEAGFSNDKIPEEGLTDDTMEKKDRERMKEFVARYVD